MSRQYVVPAPPGLQQYVGGKGAEGTAQTIINQIRPHVVYVELFLGSGQVLRHLAAAGRSLAIGCDVDVAVIDAWRAVALPGLQLHCAPALTVLEQVRTLATTTPGRIVVYADPPYLFSARRQSRPIYRHEMGDEAAHVELIQQLRGLPAAQFDVLLSGYPSALYRALLPDWRLVSYANQTRRGPATEHLYCNFPAPEALHDTRWLGADYRERERVRKKARRWAARFAQLPELERQAMLEAIGGPRPVEQAGK